ncbi:cytochrome P450 [Rhodovulum adriaticum]|uniref:Cytochrome P450 n=1 Tax=Rhodovulum adriaticum TaxID=35804 RepID=A0A4R2NTT0_RHOAD|nr:cytochrome P450 [Rhodovulum adriaticum]MBK1635093.1 cytochrome P450 [Rhodovulum adriaticum]TCP25272.1 cytochrome P450 [Rhodovulum adriaticum]
MTLPPKPATRPEKVSLIDYLRRFRRDILSAQPAKLYRARMAEFRTPFFRSYLVNQPDLVHTVLKDRPMEFPKSDRVGAGLRPLLGNSVFLTNGETWARQRRIIDPAFEGGRLRDTFPAMVAAGNAAVGRLNEGIREIEAETSHAAADVIFRTLFSLPIEDETAAAVFHQFRDYQRSQPLLNLAAFVQGPAWMPRLHKARTRKTARAIRGLILQLTEARKEQIAAGTAPDDLATKIMTTADPQTSKTFAAREMVDQVAIFFLAGHETSASSLAWALYLLALYPEVQDRVAAEAASFPENPDFSDMKRLTFTRDVFREALRLYPPVPMMVRETTKPERFRDRDIAKGAQIVLSPWHLHRHERIWDRPDDFDPDRFATDNGKAGLRDAFIPFSEGPRVCTGAGFAMVEGPLFLAMLVKAFRFERVPGCDPVPVAHLTVRSKDGIWLNLHRR